MARGGADFCFAGVFYFLKALADEQGNLASRFVAVMHQQNPMAAIVPSDSEVTTAEDLAEKRLFDHAWTNDEVRAGLARLGVAAPQVTTLSDLADWPNALRRGEIDGVPTFVECTPQVTRESGAPARAIRLGPDVYATGLVAADRLPSELVARMTHAISTAFELQLKNPEEGLADYCRRYPQIPPEDVLESWSLLVPYVFTDEGVGSMEADRWRATIDFETEAHALPHFDPSAVYRSDLLSGEQDEPTNYARAAE